LIGGALLFGALRRLLSKPCARDALLFALGMATLANSRPFEGLVVSLPAATLVLMAIFRRGKATSGPMLVCAAFPIVLVLALAAVWMGYYNFRTTGSAWKPPYLVYEQTYGAAPLFLWQPMPPTPNYRHKAMRDFYDGWARSYFEVQQSFPGWARLAAFKLKQLWGFYFGIVLWFPLLALRWTREKSWILIAAGVCVLVTAVLLSETWVFPHYTAPVAPLGLVVVLQGMRRLHLWQWRGRPIGRFLVRPFLLVSLLTLVATFAVESPMARNGWERERARVLTSLERRGGQHLVLVRYGEGHSPHEEWVYNAADIDASSVVWARYMSQAENQELLDYFKNRRVWLLTSDSRGAVLRPYETGEQTRQAAYPMPPTK
jgi:hypothetical protein